MKQDKLIVGLRGPMLTIEICDRESLKNIFSKIMLKKQVFNKDSFTLISKLYKKYLTIEDVDSLLRQNIEFKFIDFSEYEIFVINKLYQALIRLHEQMLFMIDNQQNSGVLKLVISNIPYYMQDKMQTLEYYDNLSDDDEPYWMRDVSGFVKDNKPLEKP